MFTSKRFWLNLAAGALYVGKLLGFEVPVEPDPAIVAGANLVLTILRAKFNV